MASHNPFSGRNGPSGEPDRLGTPGLPYRPNPLGKVVLWVLVVIGLGCVIYFGTFVYAIWHALVNFQA